MPCFYFINSSTETPTAFANFAIVARVGFVFPFSILLINALSTPRDRTISPCDMPFSVLILFKFFFELIIIHYSKFFKKNELEKFADLATNNI